jgi:CRP-like cAMP-binding protein
LVKQATTAKRKLDFNPHAFLSTIGKGRDLVSFQKKDKIFVQGDSRDGLFFVQTGKVQLSVVSEDGREATLGILGEGDFFGEGGLAGQLLRMSSATALTDCVLLHVERKAMMHAMSLEPKLSAMFAKYLLKRNIRYQDDLVDQLFNSSEKRLAGTIYMFIVRSSTFSSMMTTELPFREPRTKMPVPREVQNRLQSPAVPLTKIAPRHPPRRP